MTDLPRCPPPDMNLRAPAFEMPAGATDTHFHLFGGEDRYPLVARRDYTPPLVTSEMARALFAKLRLDRAVVIQPSVYGSDNRAQLEGAAEIGIPIRAVVVLDKQVGDAEIRRLHEAGARGLRYVLAHPGGLPLSDLEWWADRLREHGWHIQFLAKGDQVLELESRIAKLGCPAVIDHMGMFRPEDGTENPAFRAVVRLLGKGHWVKLSGAYRLSMQPPPFPDLVPYVRALVKENPERLLWASDWPHVFVKTAVPNTTDLLDAFGEWVPDATLRKRILVDNPAQLYQFD